MHLPSPPSALSQEQNSTKRPKTSPLSCCDNKTLDKRPAGETTKEETNPLKYWIETGKWRKEYFEQDSQVREDFERGKSPELERVGLLQKHCTRQPSRDMHALNYLQKFLPRIKSAASLRRKQSQSSFQTPSDQLSREGNSSQYNTTDYVIRLEQNGSYMREYSDSGVDDDGGSEEKAMEMYCKNLLEAEQVIPQDSLFRDDLFKKICQKVQDRNEAIVVQDIARLIVPSAENLAIYGAKHLDHLHETANESWTGMIEYAGALPKPDYSVGFKRSAFTEEQLNKLKPLVGEPGSRLATYFIATTRMYFPFLTCEVKSSAVGLEIADRQNAQSMSIALRAIVAIYRLVKREKELDRKLLAFSISHDHSSVRIYGHYAVVKESSTTFWRKTIHQFNFTALNGKEKWTTYKFVRNIYDHHSPVLLKIICSGVDALESPVDSASNLSQPATTSLSHPIIHSSQQSSAEPILAVNDSQPSFAASQQITPTTSFTRASGSAAKRLKKTRG